MAKNPTPAPNDTGKATDKVEAEVTKGAEPGRTPEKDREPEPTYRDAKTDTLPALSAIQSPEAAASVLKAKVSLLHTLTHNMSHASSLAFNDAEQLVADIRWLVGYLRSKA